ncbi:2TM domain-containing protein [Winogradskyella sp. DF17]|jgi:hypothetical protein|uniref:2TM domain-containing protein n=1 Tax=Winogradskyella pelagia TaxID=2819984 RepID=A0ABS3T117_9FLAO|nr:2TM domain-containing protein [Winogradskyella sp. DF17]MBO3116149.1 2TM domain-containing protein [Winogradskyella sp. DF17]
MEESRNLKYIRAKNRVQREKGFYNHLVVFILVNIGITAFKIYGNLSSWDDFTKELISLNVLSTWVVWGCILLFHFFMVRFGGQWEEKKINEYMDREMSNE